MLSTSEESLLHESISGFLFAADLVRQGWLEKLPWKYRCSRYRLVPALHDLCTRIAKLEPEMKTLRRFSPPERLGKTDVKGVPYPFEFSPYNDFE